MLYYFFNNHSGETLLSLYTFCYKNKSFDPEKKASLYYKNWPICHIHRLCLKDTVRSYKDAKCSFTLNAKS